MMGLAMWKGGREARMSLPPAGTLVVELESLGCRLDWVLKQEVKRMFREGDFADV